VVARVSGELSVLAAGLRRQRDGGGASGLGAPLTAVAPTPTMAASAPAAPQTLAGLGTLGNGSPGVSGPPGTGPGGTGQWGAGTGGWHGYGGGGGYPVGPHLQPAMPIPPGAGVGVGLPNGGTAEAPNDVAANAVRYALSQLGVPYVWGAASPGNGFDCSGLTSWAYGMAGLAIPRHSAAQAVGASVLPGMLMPGDLVVWSGHVAMVIGGDMIVEAGDPVQISAFRTSNIGMPYLGCYRPTG
jgi:peptidoglycan DL-endopeptidase CwlO